MAVVPVSGLVLDIRSLGRRPGSHVELHTSVEVDTRIGLDLVAIEARTPIELDLQLQSVSEGVLVTGTVASKTVGECSRCLEPFDDVVTISLTELFAYPDTLTERTTEEDEIPRIVDDRVDLTQVITDAVGLELPLQPLCEPDCRGLCPQCGERLSDSEPEHFHEILNPRWAALSEKFGPADADPS